MTIDEAKELFAGLNPLLLVDVVTYGGDVLYLSTRDCTWGGHSYQGRLAQTDLDTVQMLSDSGVDVPASLTLHIGDADGSILANWENGDGRGFKGAGITARVVFYDVLAQEFTSDSVVRFVGLCDPATPTDETTLELKSTHKLLAHKRMLPSFLIQKQCPKIQPLTAEQFSLAADPNSDYWWCGLTEVKAACNNTREGCAAIGNLRRFAGITWSLPTDGGKQKEYTSGTWAQVYNSNNDAKYGDCWPMVLGMGWVDVPVLNMRQDGNYTRVHLGLGVGEMDAGSGATCAMQVVVNGYTLPPGHYRDPDGTHHDFSVPGHVGWWNWVTTGTRDGQVVTDEQDPYGSLAVIEAVLPRSQASGENVPSAKVLYAGTKVKRLIPIASVSFSGGVGRVTFKGANTQFASNDAAFSFAISGNSLAAANRTWTHLTNWGYGPPGWAEFPAGITGTGTGGYIVWEQ